MPKKLPKSKSSSEDTKEYTPVNQQEKPKNAPAEGKTLALEDCHDATEIEQFLSTQLSTIPLDVADDAFLDVISAVLKLAPYTDTELDEVTANAIKNSPIIRRFLLARILSIGQSDPSFRTMNHIDPNALPQALQAEASQANFDLGKIGPMLMKWGPILWQLFGPIIMNRLNPTGQ